MVSQIAYRPVFVGLDVVYRGRDGMMVSARPSHNQDLKHRDREGALSHEGDAINVATEGFHIHFFLI